MNRLAHLICTLLAASIFFTSCEKSIDVNLPPYSRLLTVSSLAEPDQQFQVYVGHTASIQDKRFSPTLLVTDATVKLLVNDVFTENLTFDSGIGYSGTTTIQAGQKYTVQVSAPSYTAVSASAVAPAAVPISSIVYTPQARIDGSGNQQDAVTIRFADPPTANDYYILKLFGPGDQNNGFYGNNFCIYSVDASIETLSSEIIDANTCLDNTGIFLRDELFNGKEKELKIYASSFNMQPFFNGIDSSYATIQLLHVTEDYFKHYKSYKLAADANGNPFAEPVNVYGNVQNGVGMFSIVSTSTVTIK